MLWHPTLYAAKLKARHPRYCLGLGSVSETVAYPNVICCNKEPCVSKRPFKFHVWPLIWPNVSKCIFWRVGWPVDTCGITRSDVACVVLPKVWRLSGIQFQRQLRPYWNAWSKHFLQNIVRHRIVKTSLFRMGQRCGCRWHTHMGKQQW